MKQHNSTIKREEELSKKSHHSQPHLLLYEQRTLSALSVGESILFSGIVVVLVRRGSLRIGLGGRSRTIEQNKLLMLAPNTLCHIEQVEPETLLGVVAIEYESIVDMPTPIDTDVIIAARRNPIVNVPQESHKDIEAIFERIAHYTLPSNHTYRNELLQSAMYQLILEIAHLQHTQQGLSPATPKVRPEKLSDDFFLLLAEHFTSQRTVAFYAEQMHITPKYLSGQIKRITGKSILEWINETVITEAKVLLQTTNLTVLEISERLNFPNPSTFVQYFRHNTGTTPRRYRNGIL